MTNKEQTILNLKKLKSFHNGSYGADIDRAIKALEQEPCPDAISRQAAIDAMYALCNTGETLKENPWRDNPHIDAITDAIENLPSVNPQPKTGHWISLDDFRGKYNERGFKCSECDEHSSFEESFCPGCGAKMVEPQESEVQNADIN